MTPKELYEWAIEHEAEDYDVLVNGIAIDYNEPVVDRDMDAIDITTPCIRW